MSVPTKENPIRATREQINALHGLIYQAAAEVCIEEGLMIIVDNQGVPV